MNLKLLACALLLGVVGIGVGDDKIADPAKPAPLERVDSDGIVIAVLGPSEFSPDGTLEIGNGVDKGVDHVAHLLGGDNATRFTKIENGKVVPAKLTDIKPGSRVQIQQAENNRIWRKTKPPQEYAGELRIVDATEKVSLRGVIASSKVVEGPDEHKFRILRIDGEKADDVKFSGLHSVTVPESADVTQMDDHKLVKVKLTELAEGRRVAIVFDGDGVRKSDPPQATAKIVRVSPEKPASK